MIETIAIPYCRCSTANGLKWPGHTPTTGILKSTGGRGIGCRRWKYWNLPTDETSSHTWTLCKGALMSCVDAPEGFKRASAAMIAEVTDWNNNMNLKFKVGFDV